MDDDQEISPFDVFGGRDPRDMPRHLFWGCLRLDYDSAVRADISKQDFSVCPRNWYIDATFRCDRCGDDFCFSADEQRVWYEQYRFWIDSIPRQCRNCRRDMRYLKGLRQAYDRDIAAVLQGDDLEAKERTVSVVDQLREARQKLPDGMLAKRGILTRQIARRRASSSG